MQENIPVYLCVTSSQRIEREKKTKKKIRKGDILMDKKKLQTL